MASLRSGSLSESIELLRVETDAFDLYIKGKPFHPTVEKLQLHRTSDFEWITATIQVREATRNLLVKSKLIFSPVTRSLVQLEDGPAYPIFFENQSYEFVLIRKQEKTISFFHENILLRQAVKPLGKDILSGILNFQNEVGLTEIGIHMNGKPALQIQIEVFPAKMDYRTDYQNILREVNEQVYNLAFDFLRKTHQLTGFTETKTQSLTEFFFDLALCFSAVNGSH